MSEKISRALSLLRKGEIRRLSKATYRASINLVYKYLDPFFCWADKHKILGPDSMYPSFYYEKRQYDPWRSDSHRIASHLDEEFEPDSVIDFGCGIGTCLEGFLEKGAKVRGIENHRAAFKYSAIPEEYLERHDLRETYKPQEEYDLALSFEVAEHLPKCFGENFVESLANAGDTVVLTAAPPSQGGRHHVNEQPRSYWKGLMRDRGMEYDQETTERLRNRMDDLEERTWIPENIFVFNKQTTEN